MNILPRLIAALTFVVCRLEPARYSGANRNGRYRAGRNAGAAAGA